MNGASVHNYLILLGKMMRILKHRRVYFFQIHFSLVIARCFKLLNMWNSK